MVLILEFPPRVSVSQTGNLFPKLLFIRIGKRHELAFITVILAAATAKNESARVGRAEGGVGGGQGSTTAFYRRQKYNWYPEMVG